MFSVKNDERGPLSWKTVAPSTWFSPETGTDDDRVQEAVGVGRVTCGDVVQ